MYKGVYVIKERVYVVHSKLPLLVLVGILGETLLLVCSFNKGGVVCVFQKKTAIFIRWHNARISIKDQCNLVFMVMCCLF